MRRFIVISSHHAVPSKSDQNQSFTKNIKFMAETPQEAWTLIQTAVDRILKPDALNPLTAVEFMTCYT